jgi:hypothetical protein
VPRVQVQPNVDDRHLVAHRLRQQSPVAGSNDAARNSISVAEVIEPSLSDEGAQLTGTAVLDDGSVTEADRGRFQRRELALGRP